MRCYCWCSLSKIFIEKNDFSGIVVSFRSLSCVARGLMLVDLESWSNRMKIVTSGKGVLVRQVTTSFKQ